jgi:protein ImuB
VLAVELEWTLDLRRLDGKLLPANEQLQLRTGQPTQDMRHLRRLASEQLARTQIAAPANQLRLRTLETVPWGGVSTSLLPEDNKPGEKLHQLVERLSVRLGEANVTVPQPLLDHRPECMQRWTPALLVGWGDAGTPAMRENAGVRSAHHQPANSDALFPPWLLRDPLRLQVKGDKPLYQGPLQLLTRARRLEAAWWDPQVEQPVLRDYFIARSEAAGLLWIYRERLAADQDKAQWFLHGLYA